MHTDRYGASNQAANGWLRSSNKQVLHELRNRVVLAFCYSLDVKTDSQHCKSLSWRILIGHRRYSEGVIEHPCHVEAVLEILMHKAMPRLA
jgi:hypothetical protein